MEIGAQGRLDGIMAALESGRVVYIQTMTRTTKVTMRDVERFATAGYPLFKIKGNALCMAYGKRYDSIDYCKITAV